MRVPESLTNYVIENYGHLVLNDIPEYNEEMELWISKLSSDYPVLINDDKTPTKTFRFIKIPSLGYVVYNNLGQLVREKTTPPEEVVERIEYYLNMWRTYAENIVVSASAERIARLGEVSSALNPIYEIISFVSENDYIDLSHYENERSNKRRKAKQYFIMLKELGLLREYDSGFVPGNMFVALREQTESFGKFVEAVYAIILKRRYSFLRNVLNLSNLETVIHIANVVYYPELHAKEAVPRDRRTLVKEYELEYRCKITEPRMVGYLRKLEELDVIRMQSGFYQGDDDLREGMFEVQKSLASPETLWSIPSPI